MYHPHAAGDKRYADFNGTAEAVVLDEAGSMLQPDTLLVWGNGLRPCFMVGDEKQVLPTDTRQHLINPFASLSKVSVLK